MKIRFSITVFVFISLWASYDLYLSAASIKRTYCTTALIELMGRRVTPRQTLNALYAKVGGQLHDSQCGWSILWRQTNDKAKKSLDKSSLPLIINHNQIIPTLQVNWNIESKLIRHPLINIWYQNYKKFTESNVEMIDFEKLDPHATYRVRLAMDQWQRLCFSLGSNLVRTTEESATNRDPFYCFPR